MDIRRVVLYAALALVVYSLWTNWQIDYPANVPVTATEKTVISTDDRLLPTMPAETAAPDTTAAKALSNQSDKKSPVRVKTDVLDLTIDLLHGDFVSAQLPAYPLSIEDPEKPVTLLNNNPSQRYVADSSLFTSQNNSIKNLDFNFTADQTVYQLAPGQKDLTVTLKGQNSDGLQVEKIFTFTRGSYLVNVAYHLTNGGSEIWKGYMNMQLLRGSPEEDKSSIFHVGSFTGASYSSPGKHRYQKVSFKDMTKANLNEETKGGWIAMQQHYFLSAWIPSPQNTGVFYTRALNNDFTIGAVSQPVILAPGKTTQIGASLYIGPENTSVLKEISPGLDMTVDYGWLWFLSAPLFTLMKLLYSFLGNWGWTIVFVTILIKLVFYKLSAQSYKSMAGMRKLQPKLQALRERYGDDKAKMSQATMELYKQEKVNPLGGCLPILIQIPVFIALYWVLLESVELRQAPFIFWIKDLAAPDPLHFLPIIMGVTMLIQQRLNPAPPDPIQAKVMMFLPILFTGLFWNFPSGLVLYWIVNNTLSILQQWYITRKYSDDKPAKKKLMTVR